MYFKSLAIIATTLVASAVATDITVMVGANGTTTFTPAQVNATVGDVLHFVFVAGNHSVYQSTFADPCTLKSGGFTNDFQPVQANSSNTFTTIQLAVNTTDPIWFFCPQTKPAVHCHKGMVGAINPTPQMTFTAFQSKALALAANTTSNGTSTSNTTSSPSASGGSGTTSNTSGVSTLKVSTIFTASAGLLGLVASAMSAL